MTCVDKNATLIRNIEKMRGELINLAKVKGFSHLDVLAASQELDEKLNAYLINKEKG